MLIKFFQRILKNIIFPILTFLPCSALAVEPVALLCVPPVFQPCKLGNTQLKVTGNCYDKDSYTLFNGERVCVPEGLPYTLVEQCILEHYPHLSYQSSGSRDVIKTLGLEVPYGMIFNKRNVRQFYIIDDQIIEKKGRYQENKDTVTTVWLGETNRKTLLNRGWVPCRVSSKKEIEMTMKRHLSERGRGNRFYSVI